MAGWNELLVPCCSLLLAMMVGVQGITVTCWNPMQQRSTLVDQPCPGHSLPTQVDRVLPVFETSYKYIVVAGTNGLFQLNLDLTYQNTYNLITPRNASCVTFGTNPFQCSSTVSVLERQAGTNKVFYCTSDFRQPKCSFFDVQNWSPVSAGAFATVDPNIDYTFLLTPKYGFATSGLLYPTSQEFHYDATRGLMGAVYGQETRAIRYNPANTPKAVITSPTQQQAIFEPGKNSKIAASFVVGNNWYVVLSTVSAFCDSAQTTRYGSYVARICMDDPGKAVSGETAFNEFSHMLKAPLTCLSINLKDTRDRYANSHDYPYIVSGAVLPGVAGSQRFFYGVFTVAANAQFDNSETGSAICKYDIDGPFESVITDYTPPLKGYNPFFRNATNINSANCQDSITQHVNIKGVLEQIGGPLYRSGSENFVAIAAVMVSTINGLSTYELLSVANDKGSVSMVLVTTAGYHIIEKIQVMAEDATGKNKIHKMTFPSVQGDKDTKLYVQSANNLAAIQLQHCADYRSCDACVKLRHPLCGWSKTAGVCSTTDQNAIQDINGILTAPCPGGPIGYTLEQPSSADISANSILLKIKLAETEPPGYERPTFEVYGNGVKIGTTTVANYTFTITGLTIFTNYTIYVVPANSLGIGNSTNNIMVTTNGTTPDAAILEVASYLNSRSPGALLRWLVPTANGILMHFAVMRGSTASALSPIATITTGLTQLRLEYNDSGLLAPGATYYYSVEACNGQVVTCSRSTPLPLVMPCVPPLQVTGLQNTLLSAYSTALSWNALGTSAGTVTEYRLLHYPSMQRVDNCCDGSTSSYTVPQLSPKQTYQFVVQGATCGGLGPISADVTVTTLDGPPPEPTISSITLNTTSPLPSVQISWAQKQPGVLLQGTLRPYQVCRQPPFTDGSQCKTMPTASVLGYHDNDIYSTGVPPPSCIQYRYTVVAETSFGTVNSTMATVAVPGEPPVVGTVAVTTLSATQLQVSWTKVDLGACPVRRYSVTRVSTDGSANTRICCTGTQTEFVDSGLVAYTSYVYEVYAESYYTSGGVSPKQAGGQTAQALPTAPRNLRSTLTAGAVRLLWDAPTQLNGVLSDYLIRRDSGYVTNVTAPSYDDSLAVLRSSWQYTYSVIARNSFGSSPPVYLAVTTPDEVPGPPRNVFCNPTGYTSLTVTWVSPVYSGNITKYTVSVYQSMAGNGILLSTNTVSAGERVWNVSGLLTDQFYYAHVSATNAAGTSASAISAVQRTPLKLAAIVVPKIFSMTAIPKASYSLLVHWTTADDSSILRYVLNQRSLSGSAVGSTRPVCCLAKQTTYDASNLIGQVQYIFTLDAILTNGTQVFNISSAIGRTNPGYPSMPTKLSVSAVTSTSAMLAWERPAAPNGIFKGYNIADNAGRIVANSTSTTVQLTGLTPYLQHSYRVRAVNVLATGVELAGLYSAPVMVTTGQAQPSAVPYMRADGLNKTVLFVRWQAPVSPNGPLSYFTLEFSEQGEGGTCVFGTGAATQRTNVTEPNRVTMLNDLKPAGAYCLRIRCSNTAGFASAWSAVARGATRSDDETCPVVATAGPAICPTTEFDIQGNQGRTEAVSAGLSGSTALTVVIILAALGGIVCVILVVVLWKQRSPLLKQRSSRGRSTLGAVTLPGDANGGVAVGSKVAAPDFRGRTATGMSYLATNFSQNNVGANESAVEVVTEDRDYEEMPRDVRAFAAPAGTVDTRPEPPPANNANGRMVGGGNGAPPVVGVAWPADADYLMPNENVAAATAKPATLPVGDYEQADESQLRLPSVGEDDVMESPASGNAGAGLQRNAAGSAFYTQPGKRANGGARQPPVDRSLSINSTMSESAQLFRASKP